MMVNRVDDALKYGKTALLRQIPIDEIKDYLIHTLDAADAKQEPPNFDSLMGLGVRLVRVGLVVDGTVIAWIEDSPTDRRLDIGSAVLAGLWHPGFRNNPVDSSAGRALIRHLIAGTARSEEAVSSVVQAVVNASEGSSLEIEPAMMTALSNVWVRSSPSIKVQIGRVLAKASRSPV